METKFNSQICTTRSQSEALLKLGLKKETADCYWFYCDIAKEWKCAILSNTQVFKDYPTTVIPAWSLHRLLCLYGLEVTIMALFDDECETYDDVISKIEEDIREGYFYKGYLV